MNHTDFNLEAPANHVKNYIKAMAAQMDNDLVLVNISQCVSKCSYILTKSHNEKNGKVEVKNNGYLLNDEVKIKDGKSAYPDVFNLQIGYTGYGYSIAMTAKMQWGFTAEEFKDIIGLNTTERIPRYIDEGITGWLPSLIDGDETAVRKVAASVYIYGTSSKEDREKNSYAVSENLYRNDGTSSGFIYGGVGDKYLNITNRIAVRLTTVRAGYTYYLRLGVVVNTTALFADGKLNNDEIK